MLITFTLIDGEPVQVPSIVDNIWPTVAVPLTTGATVLTGAPYRVVILLLKLLGELVPIVFVAVTLKV